MFYKLTASQVMLFISLLGIVGLIFRGGIFYLVDQWLSYEEYSHGVLIPIISLFLIWQRKNELIAMRFTSSWFGIPVIFGGLLLFFLGELAALYIIVQYAFLIVLFGITLFTFGKAVFNCVWLPISILFFSIPLPNFIYNNLSSKLQLLSSKLGVVFIRLFDISVYLEGNVIDLGSMQLQVVEACSGLRYLFPLMSLAFICAYFFKVAMWKRVLVFLSSIPVTVIMNSLRIGIIGVTVEYWGKDMAEGFLHDFEGWFIFMVCTGVLIAEMWVLAQIGGQKRPLMDVFGLTFPEPLPEGTQFRDRELPKQYWAVLGLLIVALVGSFSLERREEIVSSRSVFAEFPLKLDDWHGRRGSLEQQYIDQLKFEDYILADYVYAPEKSPHPGPLPEGEGINKGVLPVGEGIKAGSIVNFYSAYYASQRKGESIHSPRSCIPGGGWEIGSHEVVPLDGLDWAGQPFKVNRLLIQKGEDRQLVYYWFQQRGRLLTNEYVIKWYLFWDALTMNRTDGALVRLTTYAPKGEDLAAADRRLISFLKASSPELDKYIPR
ncbi:exosortase C-terminal domain/associated protein EpsI [Methylococcus sp. EFPC2]|uniref:exosortase C-terminal domain/associated protein EpsI n=1 Tax=Methylococcus sp. EFPC2 TaxID=2812648 RepID=UPI001F087944|nr:exosortase C-terminal domain/associated protein EpsI [Methylococcus sp. EFPC2]